VPVDAPLYPASLVVEGQPCLVVGGGRVAARKVEGLLACRARVRVVAPAICPEISSRRNVTCEVRPYQQGDVAGHRLVLTATGVPAVDRVVYEDAQAHGVWVNSADDPDHCTFLLPSVLRRGALTVAVSTAGHSPGLAVWLRRRLEAELGPEYETLLDLVSAAREALRSDGRSTEDSDWQNILDEGMLDLIRSGRTAEARERLQACLSSSSG
jgi:precorrin-2 dehydrogenase/sirohydrochlorin ferrochelatase